MPAIRLPDGAVKQFDAPVSVADVAASIGPGLAKAALAGKVDGKVVDTSYVIDRDAALAIVTDRDPEGVDVIRHSTAHLLAYAVKELFPEAQVTIGPVIEDGFYYDFAYKRPFTPEDIAAIEAKMNELARKDEKVVRSEMPRDDAVKFFENMGEHYKAEIIASIPSDEPISLYAEGKFIDLCRGPHVPSTGKLKVFKLMKVAGAYWRGDSRNEMLQRIYGTAWAKKEDQDAYLKRIEEAEKRDHRKLGRAARPLPPGGGGARPRVLAREGLDDLAAGRAVHARASTSENGYQEVRAPQILDRSLWEKSGHWQNFKENMFTTESEKRDFAVKPMNCPGHILIFNSDLRSYRDLPLRYGEFGACHRNEPSGALHGIMRVRGFTQDDGHIFCTPEQIQPECTAFNQLALDVYRDFGFTDVTIKLALRPAQRLGDDATWDRAENALRDALRACGATWTELPGEGAFYGPKIEYHLKDSIGRSWQCGTMQVDFQMPARLGAEYVAADDTRQVPVMLHRAIVGSLERFIGILIENYAGAMPLWLAPQQAVVLTITDRQAAYAERVAGALARCRFARGGRFAQREDYL